MSVHAHTYIWSTTPVVVEEDAVHCEQVLIRFGVTHKGQVVLHGTLNDVARIIDQASLALVDLSAKRAAAEEAAELAAS